MCLFQLGFLILTAYQTFQTFPKRFHLKCELLFFYFHSDARTSYRPCISIYVDFFLANLNCNNGFFLDTRRSSALFLITRVEIFG